MEKKLSEPQTEKIKELSEQELEQVTGGAGLKDTPRTPTKDKDESLQERF